MALCVALLLWRHYTPQLKGITGSFNYKTLIATSLPLFLVSSSQLIMNWTSTFFLGIWADPYKVGVFRMAERTAILMTFFLFAVNSMAGPKFASLHKKGDIKSLGHVVRGSTKIVALAAAPLLLVFITIPNFVMMIYGDEFVAGGSVLAIIAAGQYINVATGPVGLALIMCGYERSMRNVVFLGAGINIFLNLLLTPFLTIYGAAVATSASLVIMNIYSMCLVWKRLGIWSLPVFRFIARHLDSTS